MKNTLLLIAVLFVGACASTSKINPYVKATPSKVKSTQLPPIGGLLPVNPLKNDDKSGSAAKPVKELTLEEKTLRDSIVGEYVFKAEGDAYRWVFLRNGVVEGYLNGEKDKLKVKWRISKDGKLHAEYETGSFVVFRINQDGGITSIAVAPGGNRINLRKDEQDTWKKIK